MKDIVAIALIISAVSLSSFLVHKANKVNTLIDDGTDLRNLWTSWKIQYGVQYSSVQEDDLKFAVFSANVEKINNWNAAGKSSRLAINKFADLTLDQWADRYLGKKVGDFHPFNGVCPSLNTSDIPSSYDWRDHNAVTEVNNQGSYDTCWSFSTAEVLESLWFIRGNPLYDFSEQQLIDCDNQCDGCGYDRPDLALVYTGKNGIMKYSDYPYYGDQGTCQYDSSKAIHVNVGGQCVVQKSSDQLKAAVLKRPVSTGVDARNDGWMFYYDGVLDASSGCTDNIDHFPVTVGFGNYEGVDVFYLRNSWGEDWGVDGYAMVSTDESANDGYGVCGVLKEAVFPIY